eukprot:1158419-Pelagomonas_calceolata.AAC.4
MAISEVPQGKALPCSTLGPREGNTIWLWVRWSFEFLGSVADTPTKSQTATSLPRPWIGPKSSWGSGSREQAAAQGQGGRERVKGTRGRGGGRGRASGGV